MNDREQQLRAIRIFKGLTPDELATVAQLGSEVELQAGEEAYSQGEAGSSMFAVVEGAVELLGVVSGVEKLFTTFREGSVFGLLSLLDPGARAATARAVEDTKAFELEGEALDRLVAEHPQTGSKILLGVFRALGERVRLLTEQYAATVAWNLEVTGLSSLNLERLMSDRVEVAVETLRGEPLRGTLLRFESSIAGHELYLETANRQIHVIPYHAIGRLTVKRSDVEELPDTAEV